MRLITTIVLTLSLVTTGCSSESTRNETSYSELRGLDEAIVEEIQNSKVVQKRLSGFPEETAAAMRQGIALNFPLCRSAYASYKTWIDTGVAQELAEIEMPDEPIQQVIQQYSRDRNLFTQALESGDISVLRDLLTNQSGCGAWIPVEPGSDSGQTISIAISSQ